MAVPTGANTAVWSKFSNLAQGTGWLYIFGQSAPVNFLAGRAFPPEL